MIMCFVFFSMKVNLVLSVSGFRVFCPKNIHVGPVTSSLEKMSIKVQLVMDDGWCFEGSRYPDIQTPPPKKKETTHQVIQAVTFFGMVKKWPFQGLSDLQLG